MWICECILRVFFTEVDFIWGALEFRIGFHFIRMLRMNVCTRNLFFIWPFYFFCHLLDRRMFVLMRALFCDARTNFWLLHNDMCCFILFKFEVYCSGRWRKICLIYFKCCNGHLDHIFENAIFHINPMHCEWPHRIDFVWWIFW